MKKGIFAVFAAVLALSLCSCSEKSADTAAAGVSETTSGVTTSNLSEDPAITTVPGDDTSVSELPVADKAVETENERRYVPDDFYMECFNVGYVSGMPSRLMITDSEQLGFAKINYPLCTSDDESERYSPENPLIKPFTEMTEKYPVENYNYLLEYISASGGGSIKIGGLIFNENDIHFYASPDSVFPPTGEFIPDVCSDYCYISAVPKELFNRTAYTGWLIPDENDIFQDKDFRLSFNVYDTSDIYEIYGDTHYLIRSREEYDSFLAMSSHLKKLNGNPYIYDMKPDLDKTALAVYFYTAPDIVYPHAAADENCVNISGNKLDIKLGLSGEQGSGLCTYMIYALIPERFMSEQDYEGWTAPAKKETTTADIPTPDSVGYSKDALILTADDIFIYGSHTSGNEFSGKYVIRGEKGAYLVLDDLGMYKDDILQEFVGLKQVNLDFDKYKDSFYNVLFVQYNNNSGKALTPYALVIDGKKAEFLYHESETKSSREDSYCFFAAVPEELLTGINFDGWSVYDEAALFNDLPEGPGEMYVKEPSDEDIVTDKETGISYVKDQLLVSAFLDADRSSIKSIFEEIGADIVGYIELTNDYQIEFRREMTIDDLQNIADYLNSYAFISNVTLNTVTPVTLN